MLPVLGAVGIAGGTKYYTDNVLPRSVENFKRAYKETRVTGIPLTVNKISDLYGENANLPFAPPRQNLKPGQVAKAQKYWARDVQEMQETQNHILWRNRNAIPLNSSSNTPIFARTLTNSKDIGVPGGNMSDRLTTTSLSAGSSGPFQHAPTIAAGGWVSEDIDARGKPENVNPNFISWWNPWGTSGKIVNLTMPSDSEGVSYETIPKTSLFDPTLEGGGQSLAVLI